MDSGVYADVATAQENLVQTLNPNSGGSLFTLVIKSPSTDRTAAGEPSIPTGLRKLVQKQNLAVQYARVPESNASTKLVPGLIVGEAVPARSGYFELYYIFPLTSEEQAIALVQQTVLLSGLALVILVLGIALLITRLVVQPVRVAAGTAGRLANGDLSQRIAVKGTDDLARLGSAFNDMAGSLQSQIRRLEELSRLQRRFTSDVSHELRTPLTTIRMATELLHASRADFSPTLSRSAELLRHELDRFESLLADLLEISRYDAGANRLDSEPGDLRAVIATAVQASQMLAEHHGSEIRVHTPDAPVTVDMDARRVERILRNLLGNALDHGEGRPVDVTLAADSDAVAVTVRDHGVGLRPGEAGPGLQPVLARRPVPQPVDRRHRSGAGHQPGGRPAARRLAAGVGGTRPRGPVPAHPAPAGGTHPAALPAAALARRPGRRARPRIRPRRRRDRPSPGAQHDENRSQRSCPLRGPLRRRAGGPVSAPTGGPRPGCRAGRAGPAAVRLRRCARLLRPAGRQPADRRA